MNPNGTIFKNSNETLNSSTRTQQTVYESVMSRHGPSSSFPFSKFMFQNAIMVGTEKQQLLKLFMITKEEVESCCKIWYGLGYDAVYESFYEKSRLGLRETVDKLASAGLGAALAIAAKDRNVGGDNMGDGSGVQIFIGGQVKE